MNPNSKQTVEHKALCSKRGNQKLNGERYLEVPAL